MKPLSKGTFGEEKALEFLLKQGFTLVARNYHSRFGEIDLIVQNRKYLVFAEVKLRKNTAGYLPREAVTQKKQEKLKLTAEVFLREYITQLQPRFDVIEVYTGENSHIHIEQIKNAF